MSPPGRRSDPRGGASRPPRRPRTTRPPEVDPARLAAVRLLTAVREQHAYANLAFPGILDELRLTGRDAALATELGYGSCRRRGQLEAIVAAAAGRPFDTIDPPVGDALLVGAYQLLCTRVPAHAAVSVTVDLVRAGPRPSAAGFANAALRRVAEADLDAWTDRLAPDPEQDPVGHAAFASAHPRWIAAAFADALGGRDELDEALAADDRPATTHLIARPGLIGRDELVELSGGRPARYSPYGVYATGDPARLAPVVDRRAAVQDEGSQLVALALVDAELDGPDRHWLDLAAGPGGKSALLGALAAQRGATVDAVEPAPHRAQLVRHTCTGLPVTVHVVDGRDSGLPAGGFDRVLLDAPCTGLGALRRRPEARWRRQPSDVAPLVRLQRELLAAAATLVRPGGLIGYVTCSPHLSETAGVLARRPAGLDVVDARPHLPGVPRLGEGPTVQLWPYRQGTDGMFLALLRRAD